MPNFSSEHLLHSYEWNTTKESCMSIEGFPANTLLDRNEGYEVLYFVNRYMQEIGWVTQVSFNNVETVIKTRMPEYLKTYGSMKDWLDAAFR